MPQPTDTPETVHLARDKRSLTLAYHGGATARLEATNLRAACRCAWCTKARITGEAKEPAADITLAGLEPLGNRAIHISFSDGHRTGVFPWDYLRSLAPETLPR